MDSSTLFRQRSEEAVDLGGDGCEGLGGANRDNIVRLTREGPKLQVDAQLEGDSHVADEKPVDHGKDDRGGLGGADLPPRVVAGLLRPVSAREWCVVICEHWPGWSWALEGLPFLVVGAYLGSMNRAKWLSPSCHGMAVPLRHVPSNISCLSFLSGSTAFLRQVLRKTQFDGPVVMVLKDSHRHHFSFPGFVSGPPLKARGVSTG